MSAHFAKNHTPTDHGVLISNHGTHFLGFTTIVASGYVSNRLSERWMLKATSCGRNCQYLLFVSPSLSTHMAKTAQLIPKYVPEKIPISSHNEYILCILNSTCVIKAASLGCMPIDTERQSIGVNASQNTHVVLLVTPLASVSVWMEAPPSVSAIKTCIWPLE